MKVLIFDMTHGLGCMIQLSNMAQGGDVYLRKSKDILLQPLCAFGPLPVCGLARSIILFSSFSNFTLCTDEISRMFSTFAFVFIQMNIFVQISKCICPNCTIYLCESQNVFVKIAKCICQNCKMYLSGLLDIFGSNAGKLEPFRTLHQS